MPANLCIQGLVVLPEPMAAATMSAGVSTAKALAATKALRRVATAAKGMKAAATMLHFTFGFA